MRLMVTAVLMVLPVFAAGADPEYFLTLRNHRFEPAVITVPAGVKVKLTVDNQDSSAEEFDSYVLNREKVIPGNSKGVIFIGPLNKGRYPFIGEFHDATAQGAVIAE
jgi:hypothetical protein